MVVSGTITCDNCDSPLRLRWVVVKEEFRGHHADLDCPLCGAQSAFNAWIEAGRAKGQKYILVHVEAGGR